MPAIRNKDLDITNERHLALIIQGVESADNKERKRHAWKAHNCLHENQKSYVKERLKDLYPDTHKKFRVGDILLTKKVVNKKAKAYREDPKRDTGNDIENKEIDKIYDDGNFLETFKDLDRIVQLHKYGCLWLKHINGEEEGDDATYHMQALSPFEFDLVRDEITGAPLIFILSYPDRETTFGTRFSDGIEEVTSESQADTSAETRLYSIWSKDNFVKIKVTTSSTKDSGVKRNVEILENEDNPKNENEAGVLPIAYVQKSSSVDYPLPSNLSDQTIEWNLGLSDYKTASAAQGHGILLYYYPDGQKNKKVILHTGMHTAIDLPQGKKKEDPGTDAKFINASPALSEQLDGLKFEAVNILDDHGIKGGEGLSDAGSSQEFASALDRIISNADVESIIIDHQGCYVKTEQVVFTVLKAFETAKSTSKFSKESVLSVTFPKPQVQISDSETLKNIKERQEQGLDFPWEKHIRIDPNLGDKQAQQREKDIQAAQMIRRSEEVKGATKIMDDINEEPNREKDKKREEV